MPAPSLSGCTFLYNHIYTRTYLHSFLVQYPYQHPSCRLWKLSKLLALAVMREFRTAACNDVRQFNTSNDACPWHARTSEWSHVSKMSANQLHPVSSIMKSGKISDHENFSSLLQNAQLIGLKWWQRTIVKPCRIVGPQNDWIGLVLYVDNFNESKTGKTIVTILFTEERKTIKYWKNVKKLGNKLRRFRQETARRKHSKSKRRAAWLA